MHVLVCFIAEQAPKDYKVNGKSVTFLKQTVDSLNNRFNPIPALRTAAVLTLDDDMLVRHSYICCGPFVSWNS